MRTMIKERNAHVIDVNVVLERAERLKTLDIGSKKDGFGIVR